MPISEASFVQSISLNEEATRYINEGRHELASKTLSRALSTFKQFVAQVEASKIIASGQINVTVQVSLATNSLQPELENDVTTYMFQQPLALHAIEGGRRSHACETLSFNELFCSVSIAIITNTAICHHVLATKKSDDRVQGLRRAVQLYLHASKLLDNSRIEVQMQDSWCELIILNNLGLALSQLEAVDQSSKCYRALSRAVVQLKSSTGWWCSGNEQNNQALVDLFMSIVFSKVVGTPSPVAPAA